MSFYADTANIAANMLAQFGQAVTRTANTAGAYNPATGAAANTSVSTTRQGALFSYGKDAQQYVRGNLVQINDRKLLLDPTGSVSLTDTYTIQGEVYTVVSIKPTDPAGVPVLYELHVRLS
jgi:hypothetical protein